MRRYKQFWPDLFTKEFWQFTFSSRLKKLRFFFIVPLVILAIIYCWIDLPTMGWKIGGSLIALGWLWLNFYQYYSTYYRCKYDLGWDMPKYIKEEAAKK